MDTKIFLQAFNSKKSSNTSGGLNVQFKEKRKLIPLDGVADVISQYDLYSEERKNCNIIRLTCQVNPVCTNVLFNKITEIVKNEGDSGVTHINYRIKGSSSINDLFRGVVYKPNISSANPMEFWGGGDMKYQTSDKRIGGSASFESINQSYNNNNQVQTETKYHPTNAIRDTQLSNNVTNFVYNCGLDILNNHLIRSKTFKVVSRMPDDFNPSQYNEEYTAFNTIADMLRDVNGKKVPEKMSLPKSANVNDGALLFPLHIYEYDDICTFEECVDNRLLVRHNGWVGFENKPKIKSYLDFVNDDVMDIDRPIMYMNGGDFVDMYPSHDLYSFVPKYNSFKNRVERNWNYCITYPSSSYTPSEKTDSFSDIIEYRNGINSLKAIYFDENTRFDNGVSQLVIYGIAKHGLSKGDYVNIYKTYKDDTVEKVMDTAEVLEVVDDYIFVVFGSNEQISNYWVKLSKDELSGVKDLIVTIDGTSETFKLDVNTKKYFTKNGDNKKKYYIINKSYVNLDDDAQNISYKKVVNDIECDYYIRIFSKLPNFKYASGDTSNEYQLYKDNEKVIHEYQDSMYDFESHISRLAFAKNIYNDNIGEVVFTDDIDISNLHDNLGRPLTSLYLTFVKNNKGYKEWYGYDYKSDDWAESDISANTVEYSHAFGKITCGIKTSDESIYEQNINSINRISNVVDGNPLPIGYRVGGFINDSRRAYVLENGKEIKIPDEEIWYETDKQFYGDLCYYDGYNAVENHIEYVMHRFNTAQRESISSLSNKYYSGFTYDEIRCDDYDISDDYEIESHTYENICNNHTEGYYYNPHYEIPIKTFGRLQTMMPDFLDIREFKIANDGDNTKYRFVTLEQHFLSVGDKAVLYDRYQDKYYDLVTVSDSGNNYNVFTCIVYDEKTDKEATNGITCLVGDNEVTIKDFSTYGLTLASEGESDVKLSDFRLFKMDNLDAPSYCKVLKDGTCRVIWRDVINNGFDNENDDIEEYPFTNGAFYVNKRVDIYVRRQDPYAFYGLYCNSDIEGEITDMSNEDNYVKDEDIEC